MWPGRGLGCLNMSTDPKAGPPSSRLNLHQYVDALIGVLGSGHPGALARMRQVVGNRRARIGLDDEAVDIAFGPEGLVVEPAARREGVDGEGETDTETVLALLDGYLEISEAILGGRLRVSGTAEDVVRMFAAIEILLDASPRTPGLQALAARFRTERGERRGGLSAARHRACYPFGSEAGEREMLGRLDLLPDPSSGAPR